MDKVMKELITYELAQICDKIGYSQSYLNNTRAASCPETKPDIDAAQKKFAEGLEILINATLKIK